MGNSRDRDNNRSKGVLNEVIGVSLKNDPQKARGKSGPLIIWEEMGKFPGLLQAWHHQRCHGRHQQHDHDDQASGQRLPQSRQLQNGNLLPLWRTGFTPTIIPEEPNAMKLIRNVGRDEVLA